MRPISLLLVLTIFASEAVLTRDAGLARAQPATQTAVPPFSISISMASPPGDKTPDVVRVGQQIWINIALTNTSNHSIDVPSGWADAFDLIYDFNIHDDKGATMTLHVPRTVAFVETIPDTVGPGGTKNEQVRINDFYDFTKPGTYEIQVKRYIYVENQGDKEPKYDASKGEVVSNIIKLTVVAPPPAAQQ